MSESGANEGRRRFLIGATSVVGAVGVVGVVTPFVKSWNPSAKAKAAGAPVEINISKLEEGQQIVAEWRGKPVFVVRRSKPMLKSIAEQNNKVLDPTSDNTDQQPDYAKNEYRSRTEEILVLIGLCTHLGCSPKYLPEVTPMDFDAGWRGGYYCPCHGSKFDLAGRVYKGVPAPSNLEVPPYSFKGDDVLVIGVDEENA